MRRVFILSCVIWIGVFNQQLFANSPRIRPVPRESIPHRPETFKKISNDVIARLERYYRVNGRFSSSGGEARFQDLGLVPDEWDGVPFEGILYDPRGDRLEVFPAAGYTFFVNEPNGNTRILSHDLKWGLIYFLPDHTWYFYEISPQDIINIKTLKVKKDTPYNPAEYEK